MTIGATVHLGGFSKLDGLSGDAKRRLKAFNYHPGALRPFRDRNDRIVVEIPSDERDANGKYLNKRWVVNAPAFMEEEDWQQIDRTVQWAVKDGLKIWADVRGTNPLTIPDGMSHITYTYATADGEASALLSMDPLRRGERTRAQFDTATIPLPVVHSDSFWGMREEAVTRRSRLPLDSTSTRLATDAVAKLIEQLTLGLLPVYTYAGGSIYGVTNHPDRALKTLTAPASWGATGPKVLINELLSMIATLEDRGFPGPYVAYVSNGWGEYLDNDYSANYAGVTLRQRVLQIEKIQSIRTHDMLTGMQIVLIQMTPTVIQGIEGMPITPVLWQEAGGMETNLKVMGIQVPLIRVDWDGNCGISHGSVP